MKYLMVAFVFACVGNCYGGLFDLKELTVGTSCSKTKYDPMVETTCSVSKGSSQDLKMVLKVHKDADISDATMKLTWKSQTEYWTKEEVNNGQLCYSNGKLTLGSSCSDTSIPAGTYTVTKTVTVPDTDQALWMMVETSYTNGDDSDSFQDVFLGDVTANPK